MIGTVTVYFNTGFNGVDIPAEPSVLEYATKKVYPDVYYMREDYDKPSIKIKDTYENLCDVDYVKIETGTSPSIRTSYFYAVPSAISQGVTLLSLDLDALLTMGGAKNLTYSSGWQERGHILKSEDDLFDNIASETWTPSQPLEAKNLTMIESNKSEISGQDTFGNRDVIITNVDLKQLETVLEQYPNSVEAIQGIVNGTAVMSMPGIPIPNNADSTSFGVWDDLEQPLDPTVPPGMPKDYKVTGQAAYDLNNTKVQQAIEVLFSAGQLQLQSSYRIPSMYVDDVLTSLEEDDPQTGYDPTSDTGLYNRICGWHQIFNANQIPYEYSIQGYTVKNKKVFGTYRHYIIVNLGSGDMSVKTPYDIYDPESQAIAPAVRIWADPTSTGKPYARFDYIKDNPLQWADTVKGLQWSSVQLNLEGASGSMWNSINNAFTSQNIQRSMQQNDLDSSYTTKFNALSQRVADINYAYDYTNRTLDIYSNQARVGTNAIAGGFSIANPELSTPGSGARGMTGAIHAGLNAYNAARARENLGQNYEGDYLKRQLENEQAARNSALNSSKLQQQVNENEIDLYKNNVIVAPTLMFTPEQNLGLYGYNKFAIYEVRKSVDDLKSEDMYYQRFGYSGLHRPLTGACFNTRDYYSYVQAFNVNIKGNFGMRIRQKAISQLNQGVRVWKVLPDASYYETN